MDVSGRLTEVEGRGSNLVDEEGPESSEEGLDGPGLDGSGLDGPGLDGPGLDGPGWEELGSAGAERTERGRGADSRSISDRLTSLSLSMVIFNFLLERTVSTFFASSSEEITRLDVFFRHIGMSSSLESKAPSRLSPGLSEV